MARILSTVWAFLLHIIGVSIFQTCFANAMEDWDGDSLLTGPPITSFLFAFGIYIIILNTCLFPDTFRKPQIALLSIYEFLATAFFLEFSMACIWTPIDVIIMITFPRKLCQILINLGFMELAEWIGTSKVPVEILCYITSCTFFYLSLHITRSLDFSILSECGVTYFVSHMKNVFWTRLLSELPSMERGDRCSCRSNRRRRSRDSNTSFDDY